jgi:hypothetical protein
MSVNSVSTRLQPFYTDLTGTRSQGAKAVPQADAFRVTGAEVDSGTHEASATSDDSSDVGQFQSTLDQARRAGSATAGTSTSATPGSSRSRPSPGVALYQHVSQYGNNEASTSALLKSWNKIMQEGQAGDSAAAAFARAFSQGETPGFKSGVLDLTA